MNHSNNNAYIVNDEYPINVSPAIGQELLNVVVASYRDCKNLKKAIQDAMDYADEKSYGVNEHEFKKYVATNLREKTTIKKKENSTKVESKEIKSNEDSKIQPKEFFIEKATNTYDLKVDIKLKNDIWFYTISSICAIVLILLLPEKYAFFIINIGCVPLVYFRIGYKMVKGDYYFSSSRNELHQSIGWLVLIGMVALCSYISYDIIPYHRNGHIRARDLAEETLILPVILFCISYLVTSIFFRIRTYSKK